MPHANRDERLAYLKRRYRERREEFKEAAKSRYHGDKEAIRLRRLELWHKHRQTNNERERARYADMRAKVLSAYGGRCACCGESEPLFLEIDHINNDGAKHRKEIGTSAKALCRWVIKHRFPSGFQLLCANCNQGKKRNGGICPHITKNAQSSFLGQ